MKKFLVLALSVLLLVGSALPAYAVAPQYKSTQAFVATLDEKDISYTVVGVDPDEDEHVRVSNTDDNDFSYTINLYFDPNEENCSVRVWNIISYSDADYAKVLRTCNALNYKYKYIRFYADESDNTVTASIDLIYRDHDVGEIVLEAVVHMASILEKGRPDLLVYDK